MSMVPIQSEMLRLFHEGIRQYQPAGNLLAETGEPNVSLQNINRLRDTGLTIAEMLVRPTGTLILFTTGEQYYAPALRVGGDGRETEILAELAAETGWDDFATLADHYHALPADWEGPLSTMRWARSQ